MLCTGKYVIIYSDILVYYIYTYIYKCIAWTNLIFLLFQCLSSFSCPLAFVSATFLLPTIVLVISANYVDLSVSFGVVIVSAGMAPFQLSINRKAYPSKCTVTFRFRNISFAAGFCGFVCGTGCCCCALCLFGLVR